ncbi:hypothetical protein Goarm_012944 [Gossypium armourianum]|uniref:Uncharacterized protein n=1 Tax=Gossypium armourianum TaxID=34283 RepID=A0A7J9J1J2_9ROSI|nr:hypothetical protein [Gossypium armourianum]
MSAWKTIVGVGRTRLLTLLHAGIPSEEECVSAQ